MKTVILVTRTLLGLSMLTLLVLGILFWTGRALNLVGLHMTIGYVFVVLLWLMALLCWRAGAPAGLAITTLIWGFVIAGLGMMQMRLMPGSLHWVIRTLHLLVGVAGMGMAGALSVRTRVTARRPPSVTGQTLHPQPGA